MVFPLVLKNENLVFELPSLEMIFGIPLNKRYFRNMCPMFFGNLEDPTPRFPGRVT